VARVDIAEGQPGHEGCDDGNQVDGDGCSASCQNERPPLNGDLGSEGNGVVPIAFCGFGQGRAGPNAPLERVGIYNSRRTPRERHMGHANWDTFCVANGWRASNTGYGNWNRDCTWLMQNWSNQNVGNGRGSHNATRYPPNRQATSHVYMTCIGGQD
jgi:cysteine-rich repeat protein